MTQEDKELLLKYLCMALPYNIYLKHKNYPKAKLKLICVFNDGRIGVEENCIQLTPTSIDECKPYLRPMSSMTEEEEKELRLLKNQLVDCDENNDEKFYHIINEIHNLYLLHHIDFMGLIPKDLAIEVTEENNPY